MPEFVPLLILYYLAANLFAFLLFGLDKRLARQRAWRIPEATLLAFCAAGGALGGQLAMCLFRHKTRHRKFTVTVPVFLVLHLLLLGAIYLTVLR